MDLQEHLDEQRLRDEFAESRIMEMAGAVAVAVPEFPCETGDTIRLVQAFGYRASPDYVFNLLEDGIPPVARIGGKRKWLPWDVWHLLTVLESRRRWSLHKFHDHKLTNLERLQLEAEADGRGHPFEDLDSFSAEQLILLMEGAEQQHVRHVIRLALMAKLREGGWL
jgi:hypothetical protein